MSSDDQHSFTKRDGTKMSAAEFVALNIKNSPKSMEKLRRAEEDERAKLRKERQEAGPIRLWVDDDLVNRNPPEGWLQVTTAWAAIAWLDTGNVIALSLDHDLGDDERFA